jgi:hypothetical protein
MRNTRSIFPMVTYKGVKMGKGSRRRKSFVSAEQYRRNWLRIFGKKCTSCNGTGVFSAGGELGDKICTVSPCQTCDGVGFIEKGKK